MITQEKATTLRAGNVYILGKTFKIKEVDRVLDSANAGHVRYDKQSIVVARDQHVEQMQDTLLHEIVHVVDNLMETEMTERQVACLATGLLAVMKENMALFMWLMERAYDNREEPENGC